MRIAGGEFGAEGEKRKRPEGPERKKPGAEPREMG